MNLKLFSIFDLATGVYLTPFPARSEVDAMRQLAADKDNPQVKQTPIGQKPQDFALMYVGEFDDESGALRPVEPRRVALVGDLFASSTVPS